MRTDSPERKMPATALRRPELLAPAGDWECARAAVENGADAIYFGLERFNARMRAKNFTVADLPDLMSFLHRRGVRGYVTFNTLIFQSELKDAEDYLQSIISAGVDAAIVQDIGICRLIRKLSPDFPIHGSTQMTVSSARGVSFARELGCNLVVLARECSIAEIEKIQREQNSKQFSVISDSSPEAARAAETPPPKTNLLNTDALPLEVFVHGALCVAYSGQCLTSEVLGGRSANRGECAQACRMPYELVSDGGKVDLGDRHYLLSPQDLAGVEVLPDLIRAGVASLKIEGRLKTPEYVASITHIYRQSIDSVFKELEQGKPADAQRLFDESRHDLEMSFSRGLYTGWFQGNNNQRLAHARYGKKRGVYLGDVTSVERERVRIKLSERVKAGDGVVFDHGNPEAGEEGGRVYGIDPARNAERGDAFLSFGHGAIDFNRVHVGDKVWKTSDPEFDKRIRNTFGGDQPRFHRPISMEVHGHEGGPMTLLVRDEEGRAVEVRSNMNMDTARKTPLDTDRLTQQLGRLGGTPFRLEALHNHLEGNVILPVSELNRLRRDAVALLETLRAEPRRWESSPRTGDSGDATVRSRVEPGSDKRQPEEPGLVVLCRSLEQLGAALDAGTTTVYCDFENPKGYREAVAMVRSFEPRGQERVRPEIFVAPPRIFKMGEEWIIEQVRSCDPDGFLVRNYDHLDFFAGQRMVGDFSLNIANSLTADFFKNRFGLERVTASYDLNAVQLAGLLGAVPAEWFEVTLHQHMPMFHMEHCVFCAFLSKGKDYRDCGRPCDRHKVVLRDRVGMEHPLKADVGCRNTVFNARAQTGAEFYPQLHDLGVRRFRIEFVNESADEVKTTLGKYLSLLSGEISGSELWRELKLQNQLGVTRGQMGR